MTKYRQQLSTLLLSFTLFACTQPAEDPEVVAEKYWQYLQTGNLQEARKLITVNSRQAFVDHSERINPHTQINNNDSKTTVTTTITTTNPDNNFSHTETFETILVLEQGHWKIDVTQSPVPPAPVAKEEQMQQMAEELSDTLQNNIESIDEAMDQGMKLFNETMHEGSKEMSESLLKLMNELNSTMQESINKMKQRRQQQLQEQNQQLPQTPEPDPNKGEGMI